MTSISSKMTNLEIQEVVVQCQVKNAINVCAPLMPPVQHDEVDRVQGLRLACALGNITLTGVKTMCRVLAVGYFERLDQKKQTELCSISQRYTKLSTR
jgi:hypothetical protein